MQHSFRIILSLSMFFVHRLIINNDRCDPSSRYVVSLLGGRKKLESNSLEETRSRGKVGRGLNFPVFPLVAIHDWAEKSQSCRGTSLRGGEELPEVYYPLGFSGRTFKPSRLFSKRKASDAIRFIVRSLLRGRYSIVMSTLSFSLPLSPSCIGVRVIEELIKIISSHSITHSLFPSPPLPIFSTLSLRIVYKYVPN